MICGAESFANVDKGDSSSSSSSSSSARETPKRRRRTTNKNPYSGRGFDKFSTVLTELEARKQKILAQSSAENVAMVRFTYSDAHDWIPVIVKLPKSRRGSDNRQEDEIDGTTEMTTEPSSAKKTSIPRPEVPVKRPEEGKKAAKRNLCFCPKEECVGSCCLGKGASCYWSLVLIMILFCLVMNGRILAICCTSASWFLVPIVRGRSGGVSEVGRSGKKRGYGRRASDEKSGVAVESVASPRHHANVKRATSR